MTQNVKNNIRRDLQNFQDDTNMKYLMLLITKELYERKKKIRS